MKPNEPIRRRIYEWPDGAWVELDLDPRVSILGAPQPHPVVISVYWRQGQPTHDMVIFELKAFDKDSPGGKRAVMQLSYNDHLSSSKRKKLVGFLLDVGVDDHPSDTTDLLYGVRDRRMATYPRWIDERLWQARYSLFLVAAEKAHRARWLGHIRDLNVNVGLNASSNMSKVRVSWSTSTTMSGGLSEGVFGVAYPKGSSPVYADLLPEPWIEPDQESAIRKACDILCEKELLLPISTKEEWEAANAEKGRFLIPSEEEVQVFKILDESLPFFWSAGLEEFLLER